MVTCSLNGGSADRRSDGRNGRNHNHHEEVLSSHHFREGIQSVAASNEITAAAAVRAVCTNSSPSEMNGHSVSEDAMELCSPNATIHVVRQLKMDHHDHPERVSITLYVKKIEKESLQVNFESEKVTVLFRTK